MGKQQQITGLAVGQEWSSHLQIQAVIRGRANWAVWEVLTENQPQWHTSSSSATFPKSTQNALLSIDQVFIYEPLGKNLLQTTTKIDQSLFHRTVALTACRTWNDWGFAVKVEECCQWAFATQAITHLVCSSETVTAKSGHSICTLALATHRACLEVTLRLWTLFTTVEPPRFAYICDFTDYEEKQGRESELHNLCFLWSSQK